MQFSTRALRIILFRHLGTTMLHRSFVDISSTSKMGDMTSPLIVDVIALSRCHLLPPRFCSKDTNTLSASSFVLKQYKPCSLPSILKRFRLLFLHFLIFQASSTINYESQSEKLLSIDRFNVATTRRRKRRRRRRRRRGRRGRSISASPSLVDDIGGNGNDLKLDIFIASASAFRLRFLLPLSTSVESTRTLKRKKKK